MNTLVKSMLFLSLTFGLNLSAVQAQKTVVHANVESVSAKGLPKMSFDRKMIDFGKVKKGEVRKTSFEFTNIGDAPLEIDLISVCECTSYDYSPKVYQPGDKGKIYITFDSAKKDEAEEVDIDIFLKTTDPDTGGPLMDTVKFQFEFAE